MHAGRNVALMGAFRNDFRFNFITPALLKDPGGYVKEMARTPAPPRCCVSPTRGAPERMEPIIRACLAEAMGQPEAGIRPPKGTKLDLPDELVEARRRHRACRRRPRAHAGAAEMPCPQPQCGEETGHPRRARRPIPRQDHCRQGRQATLTGRRADPANRRDRHIGIVRSVFPYPAETPARCSNDWAAFKIRTH